MRYGTFLCWLFGHCFVVRHEEFTSPIEKLTTWTKIETCKRCGIKEGDPHAKASKD